MYKEIQEDIIDTDLEESDKPKVSAKKTQLSSKAKNPCPECGEELTFEGGCNICKNCGYTKCD